MPTLRANILITPIKLGISCFNLSPYEGILGRYNRVLRFSNEPWDKKRRFIPWSMGETQLGTIISSENALATKLGYHSFFFMEKYKHKPQKAAATAAIFRAVGISKERENGCIYK
jgi:hypothetical protein